MDDAADERHVVDPDRFPGVTALEERRHVFGAQRRVVLTHSPSLHTAQSRGFDQTLAKATAKLSTLGDTLARGNIRRSHAKVSAEITHIVKDPWVRRVISWQLTGDTPAEHRLSFDLDEQARTDLEHVVSFSPMRHWTEHNIRVHVFTCVLALRIAHLMPRHARQHGLDLSVRELLDTLAGIEETVLIYPSTGGRPKARRMLTESTPTQDHLAEIFDLHHWAPRI